MRISGERVGLVDPSHERYDWSARRTVAWFALAALAVVVGVRSLALAADAVGVQPTVAHYAFAVLPVLVVPAAVLRLWSDDAFDHDAYHADGGRRRLARDLALGVLVGYAAVPAYLAVAPLAPRPVALVYALVTGTLLGVAATVGAAREYYETDAHPYYFGFLDRLSR